MMIGPENRLIFIANDSQYHHDRQTLGQHMTMSIRLAGAALAVLLTVAAGPALAQRKLEVVTSFTILADMARNVGGERVEVRPLVGPDGDAHVYQPTPVDAKAVSTAAVLVINGLGFEGWIPHLAQAAGFKGRTVVAAAGIKPLTMADDDKGGAGGANRPRIVTDPHAFQSLANAAVYVDNIVRGLAEADPANAPYYLERAAAYKKQIAALDAYVRQEIASVPSAKRKIITSHDAFQYFAHEYGVTFLAAEGISTEAEPSAKQIARLINQVRRENVHALFIENMSDPRLVEQIAHDAGGVVGGELYADALSKPDEPAPTYLKLFRYNVDTMVAAMRKN